MPRFGLLPQDCYDSDDEENATEPDHPLGFCARNSCNWMNSSDCCSGGQSLHGLNMNSTIGDYRSQWQQEYPPLLSYISSDTISTKVLLSYHQSASDDDLLNIEAGSFEGYSRSTSDETATFVPGTNTITSSLVLSKSIKEMIDLERQLLQQQHRDETRLIKTLIKNLEDEATCIQKEHREKAEKQKREEEKEEEERLRREESTRKQTEVDMKGQISKSFIDPSNAGGSGIVHGKSSVQRGNDEAQLAESKGNDQSARQLLESKTTSQTPDHILKGKKLIAQLVKLRESIEPFENNKAVSKRRLVMKKTIRGKLNTLSESAAKVQEVCAQVNAAISIAREEDAQIKDAIKQGQQGFTQDMACGKRYIVDLFASNIIQRVQAEGFNGPRGDGFPLAAMIAVVASENKDVIPVLTAHIYTVCRIAIPSLPDSVSNASEDEFMLSLGMLRDKNGDFESWDRFSARTENIISIMANIQASMPPTHSVLGGHRGAAEWLKRFLESLPPPPVSPLPLLTAPVLYAFLSGAGCMLAQKYEDLFKRSLQTISEEILNRLDQGEIGKPSFIRLSKSLEKGYEGFRSTLPPKAIPEMYYCSADTGCRETGGVHGTRIPSTAFGGTNPSTSTLNSNATMQSNPFGGSSFSSNQMANSISMSNPFTNDPSVTSNPFSSSSSGNQMNQFGSTVQNSFAKATNSGFVSQDPTSTSGWGYVGGTPSGSQSFGAALGNTRSNPFEAAQRFNTQTSFGESSSSPFSSNMSFGSSSQAQSNRTPFSSSSQVVRNGATQFGSSNATRTQTSSFGSSNQVHTFASPFGNQANTSASPFGTSKRGTTGASSFGANSGNNKKKNTSVCKFYQRGSCKYGNNCRYSHEGGGNTTSFSWNQASNDNRNTPFGGGFASHQRNPFA